ncbi:hypothetical protein FOZ60_006330 [Perkinsus olseni]|uniref:Uncharacterized protein n=1 Tax=Perkinsus olseni TaxID=32597 RepID=A0A7J6NP34_PEROL|nr:hypothetical protein FOZ60_006330 [Perkinsus olseni]
MASLGPATARLAVYSIIFIGTVLTILFTTDHPVTLSAPVKVGRLEVGLSQGVPTRSNGPADYGGRNALLVICFDEPGKTSMLSGCRVTLASFRRSNSEDDIIVIAPSRDYVRGLSELTDRLGLKFEFVGLGPYQCRIQQDCKQLPLFSFGYVHHYDYQEKGKFTGNALRHVWYDEVMSRVGDSYDRLLIADGKDVYFQADPFSISTRLGQPCREKVCLFSEPRNDRMAKFFVKKTREISHCLSQKQREYVMEKRRGGYAEWRASPRLCCSSSSSM